MKIHHAPAWLILATLAGCGGPPASLGPRPPHGGSMFPLPAPGGGVEVVRQDVADRPGKAKLLLYYLTADLKPMAPAPTAATLRPKERGVAAVEFKPTGEADPARAGELAATIDAAADPSGELTATIDGKPVAVVITLR